MGFSTDISKWVGKAKDRGTAVLRGVAMEAVAAVQEKTPVRTGYLRANWSAVKAGDAVPKPGAPTMEGVVTAKLGDVIRVVNPVEYGPHVEFGHVSTDGNFHPGRGMVQQTVTELPRIADEVLQRLKRSS